MVSKFDERNQISEMSALAARGEAAAMASMLDGLATAHAHTPPQRVKDRVISGIRQKIGDDDARFALGQGLVAADSPGAREIGIVLMWPKVSTRAAEVRTALEDVGDDPNWEVREWAATALGSAIAADFDTASAWLAAWVASDSAYLRRLAAVASGYAMPHCDTAQCGILINVLTPLLVDTDPYVVKSLGPVALGDYAVKSHPDLVVRWALDLDRSDEQVALTLARMFTSAEAAKQMDTLQPLLDDLIADDRPRVRREVAKAQRAIALRTDLMRRTEQD